MGLNYLYRITFIFCLVNLLTFSSTYSQNKKTQERLAKIEGAWQKDDNGNVSYTKVIENINLTKNQVYKLILNYSNLNYRDNNTVIQDKIDSTITVKGIYHKVYHKIAPFPALIPISETNIDAVYELKSVINIDSVTIILTLTVYDHFFGASMSGKRKEILISTTFPINPKGNRKNKFGKAFYELHQRVQKSFLDIESAIIERVVEEKKY